MLQNFRGKNAKDTEMASETIIPNTSFTNNARGNKHTDSKSTITNQMSADYNFDAMIEKRNKQ